MIPETNWIPGIIVLLIALAAGLVVMLRSRDGARLPPAQATRREELTRQRDALYALLREHTQVRGANAEPGWATERDRLELEAARVLHAIAATDAGDLVPAPSGPGFGARHPQLVGAIWGAGVVLFGGALYLSLQEFTKDRPVQGSLTGNSQGDEGGPVEAGPALSAGQEAELAALTAAAAAAPDDIGALNRLGHAQLHAGQLMDSFQTAEKAVVLAPADPEARTHQAIVLISIGDVATAAKALDKVLVGAPTFAEALAYRGAIAFQLGQPEEAAGYFQRAIDADPDMAPSVGPILDAAKRGEKPGMPPSGGSRAASPPPTNAPLAAGGPSTDAPRAPSPDDVNGTIQVDPAVADRAKAGDILFISARPAGVTTGPPTWVYRQVVETFPLTFTIGPANAMLGGAAPAELVITARIDRDGNAMTRSPEDLEGKSGTLAPGATGVLITLGASATR